MVAWINWLHSFRFHQHCVLFLTHELSQMVALSRFGTTFPLSPNRASSVVWNSISRSASKLFSLPKFTECTIATEKRTAVHMLIYFSISSCPFFFWLAKKSCAVKRDSNECLSISALKALEFFVMEKDLQSNCEDESSLLIIRMRCTYTCMFVIIHAYFCTYTCACTCTSASDKACMHVQHMFQHASCSRCVKHTAYTCPAYRLAAATQIQYSYFYLCGLYLNLWNYLCRSKSSLLVFILIFEITCAGQRVLFCRHYIHNLSVRPGLYRAQALRPCGIWNQPCLLGLVPEQRQVRWWRLYTYIFLHIRLLIRVHRLCQVKC